MYDARVPRPPDQSWPIVMAIALAAVALRALAFSGTELYADEAYYWLWSLRPATGYFDHPPLVAWLVAAGTPLVRGELGVRLLFLFSGGLTVIFAALLARELARTASHPPGPGGLPSRQEGSRPPRPARRGEAPGEGQLPAESHRAIVYAALLAASAPLMNLVGGMAVPDAPLAAAYTAGLWLLARARGRRWAWAGLAVGLALLAKYTAALLAPALILVLFWDGELRRELRTPWPWVGALVAVALFAPCLLWNARHDWISIRFQLGHGFARNATLRSFVEYLGGQIAGLGPVPLLLGVPFLARARTSAEKRVAAGALLPLAVTTWSAMRGKVEANWPSMAYPALCAAAAVWLAHARPAVARSLVGISAALAVACLAVFGVEQRHPRLLAGTEAIARFHGWRAMAAEARTVTRSACARAGCDPDQPFLVCANYQYASELAYYGGFRRLGPAVERASQFDLWDERPAPSEPLLFVGFERPRGGDLRLLRAEGEQATERLPIAYLGVRLRDLSVTPFGRYAATPDAARSDP
jgi:4-amino-4-deoxy-L-arabinose transferase-like glycosyltransferase